MTDTERNRNHSAARRQVRASIDSAEKSFGECWRTLLAMKGLVKLEGRELFAFQPALATALFQLDDTYRGLIEVRKALIQNKVSYSEVRFAHRMRALDEDLKGLRTAVDVGRSLGDAFAWAFYKHDQPLLEQHFSQPLNPHTPGGIGGKGELEFIRQARPVGFFVLYHGITTFLRIGDVSFYDLETRRISSLAELKSTPVGPGHLTVRVHIIGAMGKKTPFVDPNGSIPVKESPRAGNQKFEERLKKQLTRLAEVVRPKGTSGKADLLDAYHLDELSSFGHELSASGLTYQRVGRGLLLAGICAYRGKFLSRRIFSRTSEKSVLKRMRKITQRVLEITDAALPDNCLLFSALDNSVRLGWPPLFWFPCDRNFLEGLYFARTLVYTLYNPAHLFKRLREQGYEVKAGQSKTGAPTFEVTKKMPKGAARLEHFDFFLQLIQQRFMKEERISEIIENSLRQLPHLGHGEGVRLQFSFIHLF